MAESGSSLNSVRATCRGKTETSSLGIGDPNKNKKRKEQDLACSWLRKFNGTPPRKLSQGESRNHRYSRLIPHTHTVLRRDCLPNKSKEVL